MFPLVHRLTLENLVFRVILLILGFVIDSGRFWWYVDRRALRQRRSGVVVHVRITSVSRDISQANGGTM